MATYEFLYFPVRGKGQAVRYLCVDNGITLNEVSVGPMDKWLNEYKPKMPFGQVPLLKDGSFEVAQFNSILRYLGRKHGLHPEDVQECAKVDMISDHIEDVRSGYVKMIYNTYDTEKDSFVEGLPAKLQPFENLLSKWGNNFISEKISFADYNLLDLLEILLILAPECLDKFQTLQKFVKTMQARPAIAQYKNTDQFKNMPVNGNGKQ